MSVRLHVTPEQAEQLDHGCHCETFGCNVVWLKVPIVWKDSPPDTCPDLPENLTPHPDWLAAAKRTDRRYCFQCDEDEYIEVPPLVEFVTECDCTTPEASDWPTPCPLHCIDGTVVVARGRVTDIEEVSVDFVNYPNSGVVIKSSVMTIQQPAWVPGGGASSIPITVPPDTEPHDWLARIEVEA